MEITSEGLFSAAEIVSKLGIIGLLIWGIFELKAYIKTLISRSDEREKALREEYTQREKALREEYTQRERILREDHSKREEACLKQMQYLVDKFAGRIDEAHRAMHDWIRALKPNRSKGLD